MKKLFNSLPILLMFCLIRGFFFSQEIRSGFGWTSTTAFSTATSASLNSTNCQNINYTLSSSQLMKRTSVGSPYNNNALILPSDINIGATTISFTINFSQAVSNVKLRVVDVDENVSGFTIPEEFLSSITPPVASVVPLSGGINPIFLSNGLVTPFDNNSTVNNNDASGWLHWNGTLNSISFTYNRPGSLYGLLIDSLYFDCVVCDFSLNLGSDTTYCGDFMDELDAGVSNANYLWQDGTISPTYTINSPGIYWLEVERNGCLKKDTIQIFQQEFPSVDLGFDTTLCVGESLILSVNPNMYNSILWNNNSVLEEIIINNPGIYWVEVANYCGIFRDSITIYYEYPPSINLGPDLVLCDQSSIQISAQNPDFSSYIWNTGNTSSSITVSNSGTYFVEAQTLNCASRDTINISFLTTPVFSLGNDQCLCSGQTTVLTPSISNYSYSWQNGLSSPTYIASTNGVYWAETNNQCGNYRDSVIITVKNPPLFDPSIDTSFCSGGISSISVDNLNASSYLWTPGGALSPSIFILNSGTYNVQFTVDNCTYNQMFNVNIEPCSFTLDMPNVFTPTSDGINEIFIPTQIQNIVELEIVIVNRWGNVVFESNQITFSWDGKSNGKDCNDGVYYWLVKAKDGDGIIHQRHGFVQLIRN